MGKFIGLVLLLLIALVMGRLLLQPDAPLLPIVASPFPPPRRVLNPPSSACAAWRCWPASNPRLFDF